MDFWIRAAQLLLSLSILIVLHEFGHFLPARWFKTRVEKFYLFFNPYFSVFKKKIGETEWGIGWLPLGGFVKIAGMVDESMDKEQMALPPQPWEFRSKPAWQRLIIMLGGVILNIIVGFLLFIMVLAVWGEEKIDHSKLHYGVSVHPYMEQFGFQSGDQILTMDGEKVDILSTLGGQIMLFGKKHFTVKHQDGKIEKIDLPDDIGNQMWANDVEKTAFNLRVIMPKIDSIVPKKASERVALKIGDRISAVNGKAIEFYDQFQSELFHNKQKKIELTIERGNNTLTKSIYVDKTGTIGVVLNTDNIKFTTDTLALYTKDYSIGEAFASGFGKGINTMYGNVAQFKYVFTKKGAGSVGGFGSIGKMFPPVWDWKAFWYLTAFLSMMLAVMNLLPIPALDGGHVVFLLYEIISGRAPSQKFMEGAQYVGFFILIGLILFANGNDIVKLFTK